MSTDRDQHGNPTDLIEYVTRLDDPARDDWQRPDVALDALGVNQTSVVCDIGAGTGYFALRLAKITAQVYAEQVRAAGFQVVTELDSLPHQYFLMISPKESHVR